MATLRVLQVLPELNMGGVERVTIDMVKGLREVTPYAYVAAQNGVLVPELIKLGGTHIDLPLKTKNPIQIFLNAFALARVIRDLHIDIIHARSRAPAWSALFAAKMTNTPIITTYHGAYKSTNAFKKFYNSVMARGDRVIAISEFILKIIEKHHPKNLPNVRKILEGIDVDEFNPQAISQHEIDELKTAWGIPTTATIFLVPGRVTRIKGQSVFIEALRRLNNSNIYGVILGKNQENSSYPMEIRRQAEGLPIKLIPHISRPRVAYAAADFIVNPSLAEEAFGRVTAEACAMERIIIATNHGATSELCQSGKTGFLVPPGDSKALADMMMQAMKLSPATYSTMAKAARKFICDNYALDRMYAETIDLYKELVK
jgi:glycosyltransferase involved in cell wall biosynthesis